ncbi:MAG: YtxH domain-containing protein [Dehalococcoidia bacterium]|nr:MAG: YtxH domain-containing protein [Dehalococcoidia bacterium]
MKWSYLLLSWQPLFRVYAKALMQLADFFGSRKEAEMDDKNGGSGFVIGLVVGAVVGLAIGFLYAPRLGEETRQVLKEKLESVREKGERVREKAADVAEKVKETASEAVKTARAKLEEVEEQAK